MTKLYQTKLRDMNNPKCRSTMFNARNYISRMGRSSIDIICPFCGGTTTAFLWSLPNGKRCEIGCGAIFGRFTAYKLEIAP